MSGDVGRSKTSDAVAGRATGGTIVDDFDYDDGPGNHGWTVVRGGFETRNSYLHPTTGPSVLRREQPSAVGTFEFTGIQNDARYYGFKVDFITGSQQFGGGPGYRLRVAQKRFGTTELVRITADGNREVLVTFPDHSGEEFDVKIERDRETFAFTCYRREAGEQSYTQVGTAEEADPITSSDWYVHRHDSGNQKLDGVTAGDPQRTTVIDDFEDGDLDEYDYTAHGTALRTDRTYAGEYALRLPSRSGSTADSQCVSVSGDIPYPSRGDSFGGYLYQPDWTNQFRFVFAAQSASKDPDGYNVAVSGARDFFIEVDRHGKELARTSLSDVDHTGKWLQLVIDWDYDAESEETTITATLYDKGPDGTEDNGQLVRIEGTDEDSVYESGGLAFNADARGSDMAFDNARFFDSSESETVSGSATTMTLLPGGSEHSGDGEGPPCDDHNDDCDDGGDDLDSVMPDYWGKSLDAWFLADKRESLPERLEDALAVTREHPEYPGEEFRAYRMKNHIEIEFPSSDSRTIDDWEAVEVQLTDQEPSYVLVEGEGSEHGEDNAMRSLIDDPPNEDWSWFEGRDRARAIVTRYNQDVVDTDAGWKPRSEDVNKVELDGVEGVRVSVIMGGDDTYITKLNEVLYDKSVGEFLWEFPGGLSSIPGWLWTPPTMYTFLDLIVMADGTAVSRVWDTSPYPQHFLYLNGTKRADNGFDKGTGPKLGGRGKVKNGVWIRNQDLNRERFVQWWKQIRFGHLTPFRPFAPQAYENKWDNDELQEPAHVGTPQDHPVVVEGDDGSALDTQDVVDEFDSPLFPWEGII